METSLDMLASANLVNETMAINGEQVHGIWLTLRYTRIPGPTHHELPPLWVTQDQARTLAQGLLAVADRVPKPEGPMPGSKMQ